MKKSVQILTDLLETIKHQHADNKSVRREERERGT